MPDFTGIADHVRMPRSRVAAWLMLALVAMSGVALCSSPVRAQSFTVLELKVGVVAAPGAGADRYEPFRLALAHGLGTTVELTTFARAQDLIDAAAHRRIDYGVYTGSTYATTWRLCGCIEPLVAPKSIDGTAGVRSVLIVRNDSAFKTPADLKGKVLAATAAPSIAGRLVPFAELAAAGNDPQTLFGRIDTVDGPEAAVAALNARTADAALVWSTLEGDADDGYGRGTLHDLVARHALDMHAVRIVWKSNLIANGPHAVRADLPQALKTQLREILIDLADTDPEAYDAIEPVFGGGFMPISHATYLPFLRLVTPAGADPMQPPVPTAAPRG